MTEQEQAVEYLKGEWDKVLRKVRKNRRSLDTNLNTIRHYSIIRDSLLEAGFDVSEVRSYEQSNPFFKK